MSVIQKGHTYDAGHVLGHSEGVYMHQSLTQAKMMVSPQTDSICHPSPCNIRREGAGQRSGSPKFHAGRLEDREI